MSLLKIIKNIVVALYSLSSSTSSDLNPEIRVKAREHNIAFTFLENLNVMDIFMTDTATLAILDPAINREPIETETEFDDWWLDYHIDPPIEMKTGTATFLNLGGDGGYRIRITGLDALSDLEQQYCVSTIKNIGVKVTSGFMHIGSAEAVTSSSLEDYSRVIRIEVPNGEYDLIAYGIDGVGEEFRKDQENLPDIVIVIERRKQEFVFLSEKQELFPYLGRDSS